MINKILGLLLIILPLMFVGIALLEGGIMATIVYILYLFATFVTTLSPWYGLKLIRSK